MAPIPGENGCSSGLVIDRFWHGWSAARHSGDTTAGFIKLRHLTKEQEQVILPSLALPPHLEPVGRYRDSPGHAAHQLVDIHVALRIDANDDVVAISDHGFEPQSLPSQLDP